MGERYGYLESSGERRRACSTTQLYPGNTLPVGTYLYLRQGYSVFAEGLHNCLLGGEPRCQVSAGPRMPLCVLELSLTEDPLRQTGATFESRLDPIDLDQIDADSTSRPQVHRYSTVTVFARLRG